MTSKINERGEPAGASAGVVEPVADADGVVLRLWARRPVSGARTRVVDRLGALRSAGEVADFDIETWPDVVALSHHTDHPEVVDAYEAFREWADDHDVEITPHFERRTTTSVVGRTEDLLTLPTLCLAVYDEDGLRGVFPCRDGDQTCTVTDYLDAHAGEVTDPADPVAAALPDSDG